MRLPEIIMEGSHVIHTDEDGNILLDNEGDQRLQRIRGQTPFLIFIEVLG